MGARILLGRVDPKFLKGLELFAELDPGERASIARLSQRVHVKEGETILRQNQASEKLFLIVDGTVRVVDEDAATGEVLAVLTTGDTFGEFGLVDHKPPSASVIAEEPTTLQVLRSADLLELMSADRTLANKLLWALCRTMVRRMRGLDLSLSHTRQMMNRFARGI